MMLALRAVQILWLSSNSVVNVVNEVLEKRRVSKISIYLAPPSPSIHYPSSRLVPCGFYLSTQLGSYILGPLWTIRKFPASCILSSDSCEILVQFPHFKGSPNFFTT